MNDPNAFPRIDIGTALQRNIRVILSRPPARRSKAEESIAGDEGDLKQVRDQPRACARPDEAREQTT
jgi:hypothetical protein